MKKHFRAFTSVVLFSLTPSMVLAQAMPDEVDHVRYRAALDGLQNRLNDARETLAAKQAERDRLTAEITNMNRDRQELPARNADLTRSIGDMQARIANLEAEIRSLSTTIDRVAQDLRNIDTQVQQLRQNWTQEENQRVNLANRLQAIRQDVRRMNDQLDREVGEERESMAVLDRVEKEFQALDGRRMNIQDQHKERIARNQRDQRDLPQVRRQKDQSEAQLQRAEAEVPNADAGVVQAQAELSQREAALAQATQSIAPFQQRVNGARGEVQAAQGELTAAEKITTDAEASIRDMEQRKAGAAQQRQALNAGLQMVEGQLAQNRGLIPTLQAQLEQSNAGVTAAEAELAAAQENLRNVQQNNPNRATLGQAAGRVRQAERLLNQAKQDQAAKEMAITNTNNAIAQGEAAIASINGQIQGLDEFLANVDGNIAAQREVVNNNAGNVAAKRAVVQQKRQELQGAEADLARVTGERDRLAPAVNQSRQALQVAQARKAKADGEVRRLREIVAGLMKDIQAMEEGITTFQADIRELENRLQRVTREVQEKFQEVDRERRLLARIREDRVRIQQQVGGLEAEAQNMAQALRDQEGRVAGVEAALAQKEAERKQLNNYVESSRRTMGEHTTTQTNLRSSIQASQAEITRNSARLTTIDREFSTLQPRITRLGQEIPVVQEQIATLTGQVSSADGQFRQRLSLFQRYLGEAQALGTSRGSGVGTTEGQKAGQALIASTSARLGGASGSEEGRFEALLRGFVRGEIAGFNTGRDQGLASAPDAARGTQEGTATGTREARDQANQVLKPRYYTAEFSRRLADPTVTDAVDMKLAALSRGTFVNASTRANAANEIPALSGQELSQAQAIRTSLDERIGGAMKELARLRDEQTRLGNAQSVYLAPSDVRPVIDAKTCEGVYKAVPDFVVACQDTYRVEYNARFVPAHRTSFMTGYSAAFQTVVQNAREAGIQADYAANYREAEGVARAAGLAVGKEEVYQERFAASRRSAYDSTLAQEDQRVRGEAVEMVDELFAANGVAILTEAPRFKSADTFGVAPGNSVNVEMMLKNAGSQATGEGAIKVRIIEASPLLIPARTLAPLKSLPARKLVRTSADFGFKVADQAAPGQKVRLVAEVTYPGHDYTAARVERIEMEEMLGLNPTAGIDVSFNATPEVKGFLGSLKSHDISVNLTAKYRGLDKGYEVTLEEVNTKYADIKTGKDTTKVLAQGSSEKAELTYKLAKTAIGKAVTLKVVVRYGGRVLEERLLNLNPR